VFDSTLSIFKINSYFTLSDLALPSKDRPKLQFGARQPIISKCWALAPSQRWLVASRGPSAKTHHDRLSTIRVISRCHTPSSPNSVLVRWKLWPCTTNTFQDSLSYIWLGYKHWLASFSSNVYMVRIREWPQGQALQGEFTMTTITTFQDITFECRSGFSFKPHSM